MIFPAVHRCV